MSHIPFGPIAIGKVKTNNTTNKNKLTSNSAYYYSAASNNNNDPYYCLSTCPSPKVRKGNSGSDAATCVCPSGCGTNATQNACHGKM